MSILIFSLLRLAHPLEYNYWSRTWIASADGQDRIKPSGAPCQMFRGPFCPSYFLIPFHHPFSEIFSSVKENNNTLFSVLNLRSTTYSKKLIAVIVLHTLPAFCSCKPVNNVTKWYIVKQVRKRLKEDGSRYCGFQMACHDGKKPGRSTGNSEYLIQMIDHLYSPPLSKVHYGRALYSSWGIKNKSILEI